MKKLLSSILISWLFFSILSAQSLLSPGLVFHHLTKKNGLSSNKIVEVLQDYEGFFWIGTQDGLNRFDGTNIQTFRKDSKDSNSLSNNHCTDILLSRDGNIWVATLNGLNCFDQQTGKFTRYYFNDSSSNPAAINWINSIDEDRIGNIWAVSAGLWKIEPKYRKVSHIGAQKVESKRFLNLNYDRLIYDEQMKGLWCNSGDGLVFFDITKKEFFDRMYNPENWSILNQRGNFIFTIDSNHTLWFVNGTRRNFGSVNLPAGNIQYTGIELYGGVSALATDRRGYLWIMRYTRAPVLYSPEDKDFDSSFLKSVHSQSPLSEIIHNCYQDHDGNYWLGSAEGVSVFIPEKPSMEFLEFERFNNKKNSSPSRRFTGFAIQNENNLWLYNPGGLYHYFRDSNKKWHVASALFQQGATGAICMGDSLLFVTTRSKIFRFNIKNGRIEKSAGGIFISRANMVPDDHQNLWVASWQGGVYKFDANLNLLHHFTSSKDPIGYDHTVGIYFDKKSDSVFVGFNEGYGYACIHAIDHGITNHKIPLLNPGEKNIANTITCFLKDAKGVLWIGTFGGGLLSVTPGAHAYQSIGQEDGLMSNFINAIIEDDQHHIWVSTSSGINVLTGANRIVSSTSHEMDFPDNDFVQNLRTMNDGAFVAFDDQELLIIHPQMLLRKEKPQKILISDFSVFGKSVSLSPDKPVQLDYDHNFFSFKYSLLKDDPLQRVIYAYKLEDFDKNWVRIDNLNVANYTNVPPGNYVFRVKAAGANGQWLHFSKDIHLMISPPFWKTTWFILAMVLTAILLIWSLYRYRVRQLKKVFEVRSKISHDLHDEIGSTLSGVALMSELTHQQLEQHKNEEAKGHLEEITTQAQSMIQKMSDIVWAINPQNDSMQKVINKLNQYATNVCPAAGIAFHLQVDEKMMHGNMNMPARENIYLFSKEAIHNAVKYSGAANIKFFLRHHGAKNKIVISDDGCGFDPDLPASGNGLDNLRSRAKALNGDCRIRSVKGGGTTIELTW